MIWVITLALCGAVFLYISIPLFSRTAIPEDVNRSVDREVSAYRNELREIETKLASEDGESASLTTQKSVLAKQLVKSATRSGHISQTSKTNWIIGVFAIVTAGTLAIYATIGSPNLIDEGALKPAVLTPPQALSQNNNNVQHENNASMEQLIASLEKKLRAGENNPQQWGLYARSLMTVNRFEEAFSAYEKTLSLTNNNPEIVAELQSARAFAAQQTTQAPPQAGPTQADIDASTQMTPEDRGAMIQGMVDGLSAKLTENPNNPEGWVKLLRARKVLGQTEEAQKEIDELKIHFRENPEIIATVLTQSGWNN